MAEPVDIKGWRQGRRPPPPHDDGDNGNGPNDTSRRLREVEREVDRIPGEIRTQTATISGKLEVLNTKLDAKFATMATREWIMGTALWVYALIVALILGVVSIIVSIALDAIDRPAEPVAAPILRESEQGQPAETPERGSGPDDPATQP